MIPQVGEYAESLGVITFTRLFSAYDATSAIVTNELNGELSLTMEVPVGAAHWKDFKVGQHVKAKIDNVDSTGSYGGSIQYFQISDIQMAETGTVTITAEHISYMYKSLLITPFRSTSVSPTSSFTQAWNNMDGRLDTTPICYRTGVDTSGINITVQVPTPYRDFVTNELVANYGGEMYWANIRPIWCNRIKDDIWNNRPTHRAIWGRNIISCSVQSAISRVPRWLYPYWGVKDNAIDTYQELSEKKISVKTFGVGELAVDFSQQFTTRPTATQLRNAANAYIASNFKQTEESRAFVLKLSDTENKAQMTLGDDIYINVQEPMGMSGYYEINKITYDVLNEKVIEICAGDPTDTIYNAVKATK